MTVRAVLVGSAGALRAVVSGRPALADSELVGAVLIGDAGATDLPVLAIAPSLEALDFGSLPVNAIVLCTKPAPAEARALLARAADAGAQLRVVDAGVIRDLALSDLVGAPDRNTDIDRLRRQIAGKRVLITGGGGSIGGELARRVSHLGPSRLTLLDSSECNLFQISHELPRATLALADVRDARSMRRWFQRERPEVVFHAAALKQVPLVEAFPSEGVLTNVCGLRHVADAAQTVKADMIFVSTDKAVDPTGVMGASKRLGELYCQALDRGGGPRAVPVRLGNVLGSAGSVAPLFEAQAAAGKALTVTDPEVTRFFLSIPQAANALMRAAEAALNGEAPRGAALVVDMGDALPVVQLARAVIRLAGRRPDVDVPIVITGLRPGERLHEQLISGDERIAAAAAAGVTAVTSLPRSLAELSAGIERLRLLAQAGEEADLVRALFGVVGAQEAHEQPRFSLSAVD